MYIHLGNNYIISAQDVVAILNMNTNLSEDLMDIIELARLDKKLVNISEDGKEKSLVVCKEQVYLSPISSVTLFKRGAAL